MMVRCDACVGSHNIQPTAMVKVIEQFQDGDLQEVSKGGVVLNKCILTEVKKK